MPGPPPKDPTVRQRRNKATTRTVLTAADAPARAPSLPPGMWHPQTKAWWKDIWHSPMAGAFLDADRHGLYRLAVLVNDFWLKPSALLAAEIRQQEARFGLTPLDRRRLEWKIEEAEVEKPVAAPPPDPDDPRVTMFRKAQ